MTKTLADMTPGQRANCRGMWAGTFSGYTGIIVYENGKQAYLIIPEYNREQTFPLDKVTPRPDLPRAWQADGTPPAGEWEHAVQYLTPDGWKYTYESWDCRWQESEAAQEVRAHRDHPGQETRIVRRMVSQPEAIEE
ncbi:hypothetical protein ACOJA9_10445 [Corynebacterium striatum]|uniref:hypothetical protein n=1 Tax=Corynebacterium striatum TaxID=43770 RepID=UPI003B636E31